MNEELQARLAALADEVRAAAGPDGRLHTALWCVARLPGLYARFRETNESRYGEEIARLVRATLKELAGSGDPGDADLASGVAGRLRLLHEAFGIPRLDFEPPAARRTRPRKAG
jgi:hypothetical protein